MNKLGITLNPETATGKKIFSELLRNADIFVENNPPKRMKELEITYKYVKQINPRIVMTSITPFGQTGPYKDYRGGELIIAHMGGVGYDSAREVDISQEPIKLPAHIIQFSSWFECCGGNRRCFISSERNRLRGHSSMYPSKKVLSRTIHCDSPLLL